MSEEFTLLVGDAPVGSIATINEDGSPWSTPLHFAFDATHVYWLSPLDTQHSRNIERDPRVSIVVWSSDEIPRVRGVYVQSKAELLTGEREQQARVIYASRFGGTIPEKFAASPTFAARIGDINTTKSRGGRKYFDGDTTL